MVLAGGVAGGVVGVDVGGVVGVTGGVVGVVPPLVEPVEPVEPVCFLVTGFFITGFLTTAVEVLAELALDWVCFFTIAVVVGLVLESTGAVDVTGVEPASVAPLAEKLGAD